VATRRRYPYLLVGWAWYVVTLLPVIGLVQVCNQAMADRYTYMTQIGLVIALTWGIAQACRAWPHWNWVGGVAASLAILVLVGCAWRQTSYWRDSETLWRHALACTSRNAVAHHDLGLALENRGLLAEAIEQYEQAIEIQPGHVEAHNNLGKMLTSLGRSDEAMTHLRKAVELEPNRPEPHWNLGNVLAREGRLDEATKQFEQALKLRPDYAAAHCHLGMALASRGRVEDAVTHYREALEIDPGYVEALNNLAWLRATWPDATYRDGTEAVELAQRAVTITGGQQPEFLDTLAAAYAEAGRFENAVTTARQALDLAFQQKKQALVESLQSRLMRYESRSAFRDKHP